MEGAPWRAVITMEADCTSQEKDRWERRSKPQAPAMMGLLIAYRSGTTAGAQEPGTLCCNCSLPRHALAESTIVTICQLQGSWW